jgi:hypothetical protein
MSGRLYDVVFDGELLPGVDPGQVRQQLAALFRIEPAAVDRLFSGGPVVIRKAVEEGVATRYRNAMRQCGAVCILRDVSPPENETPAASPPAAEEEFAPDLSSAVLLPPGTPFPPVPPVEPPRFDFSNLSIAEPGVDLVAPRPVVPAPLPDISGMKLVDDAEDQAS